MVVTFQRETCVFMVTFAGIIPRMKMFQTKVVEKTETYFMLNYYISENRAFCEIMLKNIYSQTGLISQCNSAQKRCDLHAG